VPEGHPSDKYTLVISRQTVRNLGYKMYDTVAAVLAELVANAYDADAENVAITLPLGERLAEKRHGQYVDRGFTIEVADDGHGMTLDEVNSLYLKVGLDRRKVLGDRSRTKDRRVMGRKGIGKLAPFGICKVIEVITAGGEQTPQGFKISHVVLSIDEIEKQGADTDEPYHPQPGPRDEEFTPETGTTIILRSFTNKIVPDEETLHRQLASRFGIARDDWHVRITDSQTGASKELGELDIAVIEGTRIDVDDRPVPVPGEEDLKVTGWVAYAKESYKDRAMAGIRIYARGKLVARTLDFDVKTGFSGEFKMRDYLVGVIHADWLDEEEDLVKTDRGDILWDSERGRAFRVWGQELVKEVAQKSETSVRQAAWDEFRRLSKFDDMLIRVAPRDSRLRRSIESAAKALIGRHDMAAVRDPDYRIKIIDLAFAIGPHRTLLETLQTAAAEKTDSFDKLVSLFTTARMAEFYSLGQVAAERVEAVKRLSRLLDSKEAQEADLQDLIEEAPWLIAPNWTPISQNQSLRTLRDLLVQRTAHPDKVVEPVDIRGPRRRPDFVLVNNEGVLEIVEIKKPSHSLTDEEADRAYGYLLALKELLKEHEELASQYRRGVELIIICDDVNLKSASANAVLRDPDVARRTWPEVLEGTRIAHEQFLAAVRASRGEPEEQSAREVAASDQDGAG